MKPDLLSPPVVPMQRRVFCNRTLNMRSIRAIGYDMDYTLVHYKVEEWERRAYESMKQRLLALGWPVKDLEFDPHRAARGLVIDRDKGNLVKTNRFGFVKQAMHGTRMLDFEEQRQAYSRTIVDLNERRWVFLNTLFSLSEGCMYAQLVDLLDQKKIPEVLGYADLYDRAKACLDEAHMEGKLKAEILADPDRFVILDPESTLALLDQRQAGKRLLLITNSEWTYTHAIMTYAFDRYVAGAAGMKTWRDLFDLVVVSARKPTFFTAPNPFFEVVNNEGLLRPMNGQFKRGVAYLGGSAREIETQLGLAGEEILYVGDHMFGDVHVTKNVLRWRTALILRELEDEITSGEAFRARETDLAELMARKEELEATFCHLKLQLQRLRAPGYVPSGLAAAVLAEEHKQPAQPPAPATANVGSPVSRAESKVTAPTSGALPGATTDVATAKQDADAVHAKMEALRLEVRGLDDIIAPKVVASRTQSNPLWGLLLRAGADKSHLAYQMERYADIYTSRVSNLLYSTPFVYFRSPRGSLPHDPTPAPGRPTNP